MTIIKAVIVPFLLWNSYSVYCTSTPLPSFSPSYFKVIIPTTLSLIAKEGIEEWLNSYNSLFLLTSDL
jgi:hypothetical protein